MFSSLSECHNDAENCCFCLDPSDPGDRAVLDGYAEPEDNLPMHSQDETSHEPNSAKAWLRQLFKPLRDRFEVVARRPKHLLADIEASLWKILHEELPMKDPL